MFFIIAAFIVREFKRYRRHVRNPGQIPPYYGVRLANFANQLNTARSDLRIASQKLAKSKGCGKGPSKPIRGSDGLPAGYVFTKGKGKGKEDIGSSTSSDFDVEAFNNGMATLLTAGGFIPGATASAVIVTTTIAPEARAVLHIAKNIAGESQAGYFIHFCAAFVIGISALYFYGLPNFQLFSSVKTNARKQCRRRLLEPSRQTWRTYSSPDLVNATISLAVRLCLARIGLMSSLCIEDLVLFVRHLLLLRRMHFRVSAE